MTLAQTGHQEIDRQHSVLFSLLSKLEQFCTTTDTTGTSCRECPTPHLDACRERLSKLSGEVLAVFLMHIKYEEYLMGLLSDKAHCHDHIKRHNHSHSEMSGRLSKLICSLDNTNPKDMSRYLHQIISDILGTHVTDYDEVLALEAGKTQHDITFYRELNNLLGEHPAANHPISNTLSNRTALPLLPKKDNEALLRFETLTTKQREICLMIADGVMNKNIADKMGTSINTIKTHRLKIIEKMGAKTILELSRRINSLRRSGALPKSTDTCDCPLENGHIPQLANHFRVIVVEDNPALRQAMITGLSALGHTVRGATDGEALDHELRADSVDIVVLDIGLGDGCEDGFAIAARLRRSVRCAIIMVTARNELDARIRGLESGADAYMVKPFDFCELSAVMSSVMRRLRSVEYEQ